MIDKEDAKRLKEIKKRARLKLALENGIIIDSNFELISKDWNWLVSQAEKLEFSQAQEHPTQLMLEDTLSRLADTQAVLQGTDIKLGIAEEALETISKTMIEKTITTDHTGNPLIAKRLPSYDSIIATRALKKII